MVTLVGARSICGCRSVCAADHIWVWGHMGVITIVLLAIKAFGPGTGDDRPNAKFPWCWIKDSFPVARFAGYYGPLFVE